MIKQVEIKRVEWHCFCDLCGEDITDGEDGIKHVSINSFHEGSMYLHFCDTNHAIDWAALHRKQVIPCD